MILLPLLLACHPTHDVKTPDTGPFWDPQPLSLTLYLVREHEVCIVGDPCPDDAECYVVDQAGVELTFDPDTVAAVVPTDDHVATAAQSACLTLDLTDDDIAAIEAEVARAEEQVATWTRGSLVPTVTVEVVDRVAMPLTTLWGGWWLAPWDFEVGFPGVVTTATDGTWITTGLYDVDQDARVMSPLCGGTLGSDWGVAGAGYSWVPRIDGLWYECTDAGVYNHEWFHQVEFDLWKMTPGRTERWWDEATGTHVYPACGDWEPPATDWFPTTHECNTDPDSPDCGATECSGNEPVNQHVMEAHWDPNVTMVTNYCRDGVQDYDEVVVDAGGRCGNVAGRPAPKDGVPSGPPPARPAPLGPRHRMPTP